MMTREPNANGVKSMDLETIWQLFLSHLQAEEQILNARVQKRAGIPFLYVESELGREELEYSIRKWSARAMRGKRLHSETIFFRAAGDLSVYRHRFYVPQEKMFCCGNLCPDCVRFK
ncbi:hypothetical protein [Rossellomorea marisflavi]|uniref:Uncharacterized protein n=2 Tax=Rossellomorea marisflavi TaxID=189381 RepID=A0A161T8F1_9BACI|nr:hypothetical protein [Rossellomorea marisflavi]KZE49703.1 hypothetical protein AV649_01350 [Rossellomorea marisflavi]MCM2603603.1 hypothetical protein [Rossellomorea marisflavi]QHA36040.1 hypothetical protein D5E69_09545 [Rossellomorea marisflavi]TYO72200.1 hypothetical protein DQ398_001045 [Rossellomorea marisflavi]USK93976.1 hypothetical protein LIT29_09670 [Rossellomorea marisflavi]